MPAQPASAGTVPVCEAARSGVTDLVLYGATHEAGDFATRSTRKTRSSLQFAQGSDTLARVSVPVLVTHGHDDAIVLPSMAEHHDQRLGSRNCLVIRRRRSHAFLGGIRSLRP